VLTFTLVSLVVVFRMVAKDSENGLYLSTVSQLAEPLRGGTSDG